MSDSVEKFYDDLSDQYHLISSGWEESVRTQGEVLNRILQNKTQKALLDILDCSCGIGTQAIGLALNGHSVFASDLSSKAVERAKFESQKLGLNMRFAVSDFRELGVQIPGEFDVVISCDNSIPHLLTNEDLLLAFKNMSEKVRNGGTILLSMRDYDFIRKEHPQGMPPRKIRDKNGTRIYMQTWDWNSLKDSYELELFLLKQNEIGWVTTSHKTNYRAWLRDEVSSALAAASFKSVRWMMPEDSGYYQPVVIATH